VGAAKSVFPHYYDLQHSASQRRGSGQDGLPGLIDPALKSPGGSDRVRYFALLFLLSLYSFPCFLLGSRWRVCAIATMVKDK